MSLTRFAHGGKRPLRVVCAITCVDEITLPQCREAVEAQTLQPDAILVVSGVSPASEAFNRCLALARDEKADILVHVAADCILRRDAFAQLVARVKPAGVYAVTARGFDIFNGPDAPIGAWALDLRVIGEELRFRDAFKMDLDFCERVEQATGAIRLKSKRGHPLGCHHPIWLPKEIFIKFRYNMQKYRRKEILRYQGIFDELLLLNPDNKVLRTGLMALKRGAAEAHGHLSPDHTSFEEEWAELQEIVDLRGDEFYACHADFIALARTLLQSEQPIAASSGAFFATGTDGNSRSLKQRVRHAAVALRQRANARIASGLLPLYNRMPPMVQDVARRVSGRDPVTPAVRKLEAIRLPMTEYGTLDDGQPGWRERWLSRGPERRVLMVAPKDFAGSMFKWAEALNRHTDFAVRLLSYDAHPYGYPSDLIVPECDDARRAAVMKLVDEAGILHLKDEHSWFLDNAAFTNLALTKSMFFGSEFRSKKKVFTHYGGYARKFKDDPRFIASVQAFDARIAMTPDLNFSWFAGAYIPHSIDIDAVPCTWRDAQIFAHSPSSPEKKATYLFEETAAFLERHHPELWSNWTTDLIHGVAHDACMRRKQQAGLFFDQAGRHRIADLGIDDVIGWYGNSAVEAMAFGVPTIAHISDEAVERAELAGVSLEHNPVIRIDRNRASLVDAFLRYARSDPEDRRALSRRTRDYARDFHGYEVCGRRLAAIYDNLMGLKGKN